MKILTLILISVFSISTVASAEEASITVDANDILLERPISLIGGNIEDLNFQLYGGLYSQLLHGECFEEHVDPTELFNLKGSERFAVWILLDEQGQPVLRHFSGRSIKVRLYEPDGTVKSKRSAQGEKKKSEVASLSFVDGSLFANELPAEQEKKLLELATGDSQVSRHWRKEQSGSAQGKFTLVRDGVFTGTQAQHIQFVSGTGEVGINNAGLFRKGINLVGGKPYEGVLRIKTEQAQPVFLSLRDANGKVLGEQVLNLADKPDEYQKVTFNLTPNASASAGKFAITLHKPGEITVDYAFLQPGEWGRYHGLPVRKEMAEAMLGMGVKTIRYNGSMVNRNPDGPTHYRWKKMILPVDQRTPYQGFFNPYASHGFTMFEFMDFAEVAGLTCMVGIHTAESEEDMADFVDYCLGGANTEWGKRRIANGHPKPYLLQAVQIGNEERLNDQYVTRFKALASTIWSRNRDIDVAASNNYGKSTPNKKAPKPLFDLAKWLLAQGRQDRFIMDSHYRGDPNHADTNLHDRVGMKWHNELKEGVPGFNLRLWPMEENHLVCTWERGLGHAHNLNTMQRMPLCLERSGTANVFQSNNLQLIWDQGRIHFTPSQIYFQASYYVDRMFADEWLPVVLNATSSEPKLDVLVKKSTDGNVLTLYVANVQNIAVEARLEIKGFRPSVTSVLRIASPDLKVQNTADNPMRITSKPVDWKYTAARPVISFPGYSFTTIRLTR